ncbi:MAG: polymer-forming cytoskeletal protein [Anaerolineales bacterium]
MKRIALLFLFAAIAVTACGAKDHYSGTLITDGDHRIEAGQTLETVTVMLGGRLVIEDGGRLIGSILMLGGDLTVNGTVIGDVSAAAGAVRLGPDSTIDGTLLSADAEVSQSDGAVVDNFVDRVETDLDANRPAPWWQQALTLAIQLAIRAAIAYGLLLLLPRPLDRAAETLRRYPHIAAAVGVLAAIVILVLLVQMAFTVVLIPVSVGLGVLFVGALWLTNVVYGTALAPLAHKLFRDKRPSLATSGALATAGFALVFELLGRLPLAGAPLQLLVVTTGLGALILTRFGLRAYVAAPDRDLL